jgi:hypothetical protein
MNEMNQALEVFAKLFEELELFTILGGDYKEGVLCRYNLTSQHPFITIRTIITSEYAQMVVINRFTSATILSNCTTLPDVKQHTELLRAYMKQYVQSEVV